ncbi:MAG: hypothetical protein K2X47_12855, partial [Bdellovibrionales bacterium]|nr:hypothetical protein [Bdellovibrionales bacterium]
MFERELWKRMTTSLAENPLKLDADQEIPTWISEEWLQGGFDAKDKRAAALYLARSKNIKLLFDLAMK